MWKIVGGIFLGWGLGSNDFANIFGTSVTSGLVRYRTAVILCSVFLLVGALLEGPKCMGTVGQLSGLSGTTAFVCATSAAIVIAILTYFALPASICQAIVGAILGAGLISGTTDFARLYKIIICWVLTPIGALIFAILLYKLAGYVFNIFLTDIYRRRVVLTAGVLLAGCYGAYSFGANNVANVTGVYAGSNVLTPFMASVIGGASMAFGVLTYSRKVMETVGKKVVPLDAFSAFVATLSNALTLHVFTQVGVPVSSTQAIVGAVIGVGLTKDYRTVSFRMVSTIGIGWLVTPLSAGILSYVIITAVPVNTVPTAPDLHSPAHNEHVTANQPALSVRNSFDKDGQSLSYEFEVYQDEGLRSLVASVSGVLEGKNTTAWKVDITLDDNSFYYWRARAYDGMGYSKWMDTAKFLVHIPNELPSIQDKDTLQDNMK
jgi:PiT family inorganic phosphate transporter